MVSYLFHALSVWVSGNTNGRQLSFSRFFEDVKSVSGVKKFLFWCNYGREIRKKYVCLFQNENWFKTFEVLIFFTERRHKKNWRHIVTRPNTGCIVFPGFLFTDVLKLPLDTFKNA